MTPTPRLISLIAIAAPAAQLLGETYAFADYEPNQYTDPESGEILEYNVFVPEGYDENAATRWPLMICLHAANDQNPPNRTLSADGKCWVENTFANAENQELYASFFLIPISQTNSSGWGDAGPNNPIAQEQKFEGRLTVVVLNELLTRYSIDPDRLYITGPSMGARGTWDIIRRHPTMFAAAAPAAGPASAADAELYASQNIWSINGENDSTAGDNREAIDAIRAVGGNPIYTELAGHGHDSWRTVYPDPAFMEWMYAQRRGVPWWSHAPAGPVTVPGADLTFPAVVPPPGLDENTGFPNGEGVGGAEGVGGGASGAAGQGGEAAGGQANGLGGGAGSAAAGQANNAGQVNSVGGQESSAGAGGVQPVAVGGEPAVPGHVTEPVATPPVVVVPPSTPEAPATSTPPAAPASGTAMGSAQPAPAASASASGPGVNNVSSDAGSGDEGSSCSYAGRSSSANALWALLLLALIYGARRRTAA